MPYVPRPPDTIKCAHCKKPFERRHASRKYCSNSCNVLASYERTGYRGEPRASRADLERALAKMMELMKVSPPTLPTTPKPAAKALTKKPAAKAAVKPAAPKPAAKAVAKAPTKKPAAKAAVKPAPKKVAQPAAKAITAPKPAKKAAKRTVKKKEPAVRVIRL
jgi:hypothetical protein